MKLHSNEANAIHSLNGNWLYAVDPDDRFDPEDLEDTTWDEMSVPNNWHFDGLENYDGTVWFRTTFDIDSSSGVIRLRFNGVDYFTNVWLNETYLGDHEGYFEPFEFEITDALRDGEQELLVRVESPCETPGEVWPDRKRLIKGVLQHWDGRPGSWSPEHGQDWNTGGVWNDVVVYETNHIRVKNASYAPTLLGDDSAAIRAKVILENLTDHAREVDLTARVTFEKDETASDERTRTVRAARGETEVELSLRVEDPKLWWTWDLGEQHLYEGTMELSVDGEVISERSDQFGIREITLDDTSEEWRLNGEIFYPRGSNHIPSLWLSRYTSDQIDEDISLMRKANLNAIRVCVHVTTPEFYCACDKAGVLIWQDFPLQWSYDETPEFFEEAGDQLEGMIDLLYNHPSIGVWCCHNEPSFNTKTLDNVLYQRASEADSTRFIEHHSDFRDHPYPGWYYDHYREYRALPDAPFVNEFGTQALPDADYLREFLGDDAWPPDWDRWTYHDFQYDQTFNVAEIEMGDSLEEFVANSQRYQYDAVKFGIEQYRRARDETTGLFHFMFVDCWPAITWSVLDKRREPKEGFNALRKAFQTVLPTIDVGRHTHIAADDGRSLFRDVVVVNDGREDLDEVTVRLRFVGDQRTVIEEEYNADLPAHKVTTVLELHHSDDTWGLTDDVEPGTYELVAEVVVDGQVISRNDERINVVEAVAAQKVDL